MRCFLFILFVLMPFLALATPVQVYHLKNGLTLIVKEDHRAPVIVTEVWYKVGSSYEHDGITGISHVLEHMMFRGTKRYPAGQLEQLITENGGQFNAFTAQDFTAYYEKIAANKLALCFKLESDRMRHLLLTQKDFKKEIQVVMEERRLRTDDNPQALTAERFNATAFVASPYRHPVVGWMKDLRGLNVEEVRAWYRKWYAPNNAIIVVVGDVKHKQVYQLAKKYFGSLKAEKIFAVTEGQSLKPLGERGLVVNAPAKLPWLVMGYNVPVIKTESNWKPYALLVLSGILGAGNSARLPTILVRQQQLASSVSADYDPFSRLNDLFVIDSTPAKGRTIRQLRNAIFQQIQRLQKQLVTADELNRVKAQVIATKIYAKDSVVYQANELGSLVAVGLPWRLAEEYVKNIDKITPQQIREVAREFLTKNRLTIGFLHPLPIKQETAKTEG